MASRPFSLKKCTKENIQPKERRRRTGGHEPSVKIGKRNLGGQSSTVENVDDGALTIASGCEILQNLSSPEVPALKKKEKMQAKHDALMQGLEKSSSLHSKSHARRLKRKAKEQIAYGLDDMRTAIAALDQDIPTLIEQPEMKTLHVDPQPKKRLKFGLIGEGKKATLSNSQRKHALQLERVRHPLILANPDFASSPFQTIRIHAQNTLVKRELS
ncbi:hypothetical protein C0992_012325 [Termitomyces sp. T32_za158]|nr:hypothetical protein C0992_012325 [Termitomyces sp. T32_za158]